LTSYSSRDHEVVFRVLGPVEARVDGDASDLGAPKQRLLLALLIFHANDVVSRETAVDALWESDPPNRAEAALQVYVHHLRRALGQDRIITRGTGYLLRADPDEIDAFVFERRLSAGRAALATGDDLRAKAVVDSALELWRGEALAGLPFVPFVNVERDRLAELRLVAEELRTEARLALGDHVALIPELSAMAALHPYREQVWGQLMLALYRSERQADALQAYRRAYAKLGDELGVEPSPQLRELERAILRHDPSLAIERAAAATARLALPRPATPLIGREPQIDAVEELFQTSGARLVTLVGPGGVGKTRLAIAVAESLGVRSSEGAVFVELANLVDASLVRSAVATAVGVADEGDGSSGAVLVRLASSDLLLVLDNFEHVLDAAPAIAQLLAGAPKLRIVATSRAPLRLSGEHVYSVPPLETPRADLGFDKLEQNDSVSVFVARARAIDPGFELTEANAPFVGEICRLLDGIPLAIELAAARSNLLAPQQIVGRIAHPLELLAAGDRDLPVRHQTLRATIEWSYDLLAPEEQALFERLSVFAGNCSLEALVEVCDANLDSLAGLLDHSLLRREQEPGGESRFGMLATIRGYADGRLADDERPGLRHRHALHFLESAERTREIIAGSGAREAEFLAELERDHDNYRAALRWARETGDSDTLLRLVTALRVFWMVRGHLAEGRSWFESALSAPGGEDGPARAAALSAGGILVYRAGEFELARRWWEEARDLFEQAGDAAASARTLGNLAGIAHAEGELDRAAELWQQSANELRELGDEMRLAIALGNLGVAASSQGRYQQAVEFLTESLVLAQRANNWITECSILFNLGRATFELGDVTRGRRLIQDALRIADQLGYRELVAHCLLGLADIAAAEGDDRDALRLLGACDYLADTLGIRFQGDELAIRERAVTRLGSDAVAINPPDGVDVAATVASALS
jgi:predicted ATPase/DNA-binding SARP family transcriptional activator